MELPINHVIFWIALYECFLVQLDELVVGMLYNAVDYIKNIDFL